MTYVASRAYRAARREAEELEDVEVGSRVTCHVSRVTCHVSRVTMMLVSVSSCYILAPGHHPRLPPPQCPLHHRKGDDRCGNVMIYVVLCFCICILQTFLCYYNTMNAADLCRDERGKWRWPVNGADLVTPGIYLGDETTALCTG